MRFVILYGSAVHSYEFLFSASYYEPVSVKVPIAYVGTSPAIKEGGNFQALRRELVVQVLPTAIPANITIDISKLMMGDNIHLNDVVLPEGVTVKSAVNFTICAMEAPEVEEKRGADAAAAPAKK